MVKNNLIFDVEDLVEKSGIAGEVFTGSPLVLESSDAIKATISSSDSVHFGISYLVIT